MDKEFINMCIGAREIQKILKDEFDWSRQGYCTQHKCLIEESMDGYAICPAFVSKYYHLINKNGHYHYLSNEEEKKFGIGSEEDCEHNHKWIGLPTYDQLLEISNLSWGAFDLLCLQSAKNYVVKKRISIEAGKTFTNYISKEKAALLAIMKYKYHKIWSERGWRKNHLNI